ncbi:MAG: hypothetical protein ACKVPX_11480 [Myxococcaceae bacterium]
MFFGVAFHVGLASAAVFRVGTFAKDTGPAPALQTVSHNLGTAPKALVLWTVGPVLPVPFDGLQAAYGFTDGVNQSTVGLWSEDGAAASNSGRQAEDSLIVIFSSTGTLASRANLVSWGTSTFTLNWSLNAPAPTDLHYWIVGGNEVQARVVKWPMRTVPGTYSVTGIGFSPRALLSHHAGDDYLGMGAQSGLSFGIGMAVQNATFAISFLSESNATPSRTETLQSNEFLTAYAATGVATRATLQSMDSDGFTVNFAQTGGAGGSISTLALGGVLAQVGTFAKPIVGPGPYDQSVAGVGFAPEALWFFSTDERFSPIPTPHVSLLFAASDTISRISTIIDDSDNASPTSAHTYVRSDVALACLNFDIPSWEASERSIDTDGFTLTWQNNTGRDADIGYVAFATDSAAPCLTNCSGPPGSPGGAEPDPWQFQVGCACSAAAHHGHATLLLWAYAVILLQRPRRARRG